MGKSIWFRPYTLEEASATVDRYMHRHLGMQLTELGPDYVVATLPVDERTKMPLGLLHGGASCVLAESVGSYGSGFVIDPETQRMVGIEINANHLRSAENGVVTGTARPIHIGRSLHVWGIEITDEAKKLVCISRLTVSVFDKR